MKHNSIGGLDVSRIGLGAMSMSAYYTGAGSDDAESIRTIHRALDLGVTHIDTAEIYGPYANAELVGRAIKGRRDGRVGRRGQCLAHIRQHDGLNTRIECRGTADTEFRRQITPAGEHSGQYLPAPAPPPALQARSRPACLDPGIAFPVLQAEWHVLSDRRSARVQPSATSTKCSRWSLTSGMRAPGHSTPSTVMRVDRPSPPIRIMVM